jgi:hypothetical protein
MSEAHSGSIREMYPPELLDELARIFAAVALERLLNETLVMGNGKRCNSPQREGLDSTIIGDGRSGLADAATRDTISQ